MIVGGGSSGLSLARKLLGCNEVVLIERGTFDLQSSNQGDGSEVKLNIYPQLNIWCFRSFVSNLADRMCTATQLNLCSRVISYAQGFGGGGSGGVNAMIYTLGSKFVYDQFWGASWCSERIETLLAKILCYYQPRKMKSSGFVREMLSVDSVNDCSVVDCNGYMPDYYASIEKLGTDRLSQVRACLGPEIPKGLTILEHCTVQRVTFDGADAKGVVVSQRNNDGSVTEKLISPAQGGEIILCAGVFESPRILLASGLKEGIAGAVPVQ